MYYYYHKIVYLIVGARQQLNIVYLNIDRIIWNENNAQHNNETI
jgi:hypothetical protein